MSSALSPKLRPSEGKGEGMRMIEHNVGVAPAKTYTLKRFDMDYVENVSLALSWTYASRI